MKLCIKDWKEFIVGEIFDCSTTKSVSYDEIIDGDTIYITRSALNNGCSGFIEFNGKKVEDGNCITIGAEGKVAFYQNKQFLPGVKIYVLRNEHLNQNIGLFIATILNKNCYKYSYGRARILSKIKDEIILLPKDINGNPDWKFMNDYIECIKMKETETGSSINNSLTTINKNNDTPFDVTKWKPFALKDLFDIKYGINMELQNCIKSDNGINFVARTSENNGISSKVEIVDNKTPQNAGLITVAGGGSVLSTFYQPKEFYSGRDLYVLTPKEDIDIYAKMFLITLIRKEKFKYSYGRQANKTLPNIEIKLPVTDDKKPDYSFMSSYMKKLPYADRILKSV